MAVIGEVRMDSVMLALLLLRASALLVRALLVVRVALMLLLFALLTLLVSREQPVETRSAASFFVIAVVVVGVVDVKCAGGVDDVVVAPAVPVVLEMQGRRGMNQVENGCWIFARNATRRCSSWLEEWLKAWWLGVVVRRQRLRGFLA
jgi:hypothetical protein